MSNDKKSIIVPILAFACYLGILLFLRDKLPPPGEFIQNIKGAYSAYGYPIVFFGALLESLFLIGIYVPGSTVILLGAALSRTGVVSFPVIFILGTLGLLCGYIGNYMLGRYGWYHVLAKFGLQKGIEIGRDKLEKHGVKAILIGYFFPGSASFLSTAAGILKMPFGKFVLYSLLAQSFWSLLWGGLAYIFGLALVEFILKYFVVLILGIGIVWLIRKVWKKR